MILPKYLPLKLSGLLAAVAFAALAPLPSTEAAPANKSAAATSPGQLLESEPLDSEFSLDQAGKAFAIRYTSTNGITGKGIVEVTGAIFLPKGKAPAGGWPIIAWAHGTVGVGDDCAPSANPRSERDSTYLNSWLDQGYAIVATDYQGLGSPGPHPYLDTRAEAYSTLDSVRAALSGQYDLANKVVIVGQSQGGGAAFATAGTAPQYAPDVHVLGTVATGLPNLEAAAAMTPSADDANKPDHRIAYLLYIAAAAEEIDPNIDPEKALTPKAMAVYDQATGTCIADMEKAVVDAGLTQTNSFKGDFWKRYGRTIANINYPTLQIATPVFVGTGADDIDTPAAAQTALVQKACAAGSIIEAHVYPGLDHSGAVNGSFQDSRQFVARLLAGEKIAGNCPS